MIVNQIMNLVIIDGEKSVSGKKTQLSSVAFRFN
jgi:hypothetical protein